METHAGFQRHHVESVSFRTIQLLHSSRLALCLKPLVVNDPKCVHNLYQVKRLGL